VSWQLGQDQLGQLVRGRYLVDREARDLDGQMPDEHDPAAITRRGQFLDRRPVLDDPAEIPADPLDPDLRAELLPDLTDRQVVAVGRHREEQRKHTP
jgi:hypothetical protein